VPKEIYPDHKDRLGRQEAASKLKGDC